MEELEDRLFDDAPRGLQVQRRSFQLRKSLVLLRRIVIPMSEVVGELMRHDLHVVGDDLSLTTRTSTIRSCAPPSGSTACATW